MSNSINIGGKEIDIKQYRNDWALALMSQGIIVRLSISRWRGTAPLNTEDLGLKFLDKDSALFMKKYVRLGTEKLLPPEVIGEIESIEFRARNRLREFSFETVWGRFVPYTAFNEWERENAQIRTDFMEAAKVLGERYNEIIDMVKKEYLKMAKDVWARLYPEGGNPTESFLEDFVSRIVSKIPSRNDIIASFRYDTTFFIIPMPSLIEENVSKARQIRMDLETKELEHTLEGETKKRVAEEYLKRKQELIDSFLEATVSSMRNYIAELCDTIIQSMSNSSQKDITKTQKNRIKNMIGKVKMLNFHNDKEIACLLKDLDMEIDKFKGERDKNVVIRKLQEIVKVGAEEFLPSDFNPAISYLEV